MEKNNNDRNSIKSKIKKCHESFLNTKKPNVINVELSEL
jgi:hypothetical protein